MFVKILTSLNAFDKKWLSVFFYWSEFTKFAFCQNFPAGFARQEALNKDNTVWLDGATPANTYNLVLKN
jgi:hypothetical protein